MKNVWVICRKELRSYFASPIAYAVMALFALIFGLVFFSATGEFVAERRWPPLERQRVHYSPAARICRNSVLISDSFDQHATHR